MICGQPIRITTQAAWIHHDQHGDRSVHLDCGSPLKDRREQMTEEPDTATIDESGIADEVDDDTDNNGDEDEGEEAAE